jgi:hypothetical protein
MSKHEDFIKIENRFLSQYGEREGLKLYHAFVSKKGYDDTKPLPKKRNSEKKERLCLIRGVEIKENSLDYHIEGLIATDHVDDLDLEPDIEIPDMIPKETLESLASQGNSNFKSRVMGRHHSEGHPYTPEYYGVADVDNNPLKVVQLNDGHWGLYADTKLLKSDPMTPEIIRQYETGELNGFSITYDTKEFMTTDFDFVGDRLVRILLPGTVLHGYTAASNGVNPNALATNFGFKEFKELVKGQKTEKEVEKMSEENNKDVTPNVSKSQEIQPSPEAAPQPSAPAVKSDATGEDLEQKEFEAFKAHKAELEKKEFLEATVNKTAEAVLGKLEIKEKVLKDGASPGKPKEVRLEMKEFMACIENPNSVEVKESFRRAAAVCEYKELDWQTSYTPKAESREFKSFGTNGTKLEFKSLGISTNQNADTDYLQSSAELQDVYDPVIYNALNQETVTWNLLSKDDYSKKGNNMCQFTLKTAANKSAGFYTDNSVATGNVSRLKYQTKFKKIQVGVSVDGDIIAAARGGPVSDVFAQEVMDSTMDMLSILNAALFAEVGLETAAGVIGFEYIADSAGNTALYSLTRSAANKLAPDSATDTYINGASAIVTMGNLRKMKRQARTEGANKRNLVYITSDVQGDLLRGKFDDSRRMLKATDTDFGFSTDLFIDGIPVFEDKDCNDDDWFLVDLETHRVGIWVPATIERLAHNADSQEGFVKMYFATFNRAPRRLSMCYGNATA